MFGELASFLCQAARLFVLAAALVAQEVCSQNRKSALPPKYNNRRTETADDDCNCFADYGFYFDEYDLDNEWEDKF